MRNSNPLSLQLNVVSCRHLKFAPSKLLSNYEVVYKNFNMNPPSKHVTGNSPKDNSRSNKSTKKDNSEPSMRRSVAIPDKGIRKELETGTLNTERNLPRHKPASSTVKKNTLEQEKKYLIISKIPSPIKVSTLSENKNAVNKKGENVKYYSIIEPLPRPLIPSLIETSKNISNQTQSSKKLVSPQKSQIQKTLIPILKNNSQKLKPSTSFSTKQEHPKKISKDIKEVPQGIIVKRIERETETKKEMLSDKINSTTSNKKVVHFKDDLPGPESRTESFRRAKTVCRVLPPPILKYDQSSRPNRAENFLEMEKKSPKVTFSNIIQVKSVKENSSSSSIVTETIKKSAKKVEFKLPPIVFSDKPKVVEMDADPNMKFEPINTDLSSDTSNCKNALKPEQLKKIREVAEASSTDCRSIVSFESQSPFNRETKKQELIESVRRVENWFEKNPSYVLTQTEANTYRGHKTSQIEPLTRLEKIQGESLGVALEQPHLLENVISKPSEYLRTVEERSKPAFLFSQDMKPKEPPDVEFVANQLLSFPADKIKPKRVMFADPLISNRSVPVEIPKMEKKVKKSPHEKFEKPCGLARIQGQYLGIKNPTMMNLAKVKSVSDVQNRECAKSSSIGFPESFANTSIMPTSLFDTPIIVDNTAQIVDCTQTDNPNTNRCTEKSQIIQENSVQTKNTYLESKSAKRPDFKNSIYLSDTSESKINLDKEVKQEGSKQGTPKREQSEKEQNTDKKTKVNTKYALMEESYKAENQKQHSDSMIIKSKPLVNCNSGSPTNAKSFVPLYKENNPSLKKTVTFTESSQVVNHSKIPKHYVH